MRFVFACIALAAAALAQTQPKSATIPFTLDHGRIMVEVDLPLSNGETQRARASIEIGNKEQWMAMDVAGWMGLTFSCDGQVCSAKPSTPGVTLEIRIGGIKIFLPAIQEIKIPASGRNIAPGTLAKINIPSAVLRNYDILIDFPRRELTLAQPGNLKFTGVKSKMIVNSETGLIQIPSRIENKKYNLALDHGSPMTFLNKDLFDQFATAHPDWPRMTGAVGPANVSGSPEELNLKLMRLDRLQFGPLFLTNVAVANAGSDKTPLEKSSDSIAGSLGTEALQNYRVALDYAHSVVYFEIGRTFNFPGFDVVGSILRPEEDGRFTIAGIANYNGKPSIPAGPNGVEPGDQLIAVDNIPTAGSTLGQVWSMLGGTPGKERILTIARAGKQFTVAAQVQHFLPTPE